MKQCLRTQRQLCTDGLSEFGHHSATTYHNNSQCRAINWHGALAIDYFEYVDDSFYAISYACRIRNGQ